MCELTKKTVFFKRFSEHNVNFVMDLLDNYGKFKSWHTLKTKYNLNSKFYFQWLQLTDAAPKTWKNIIQNNINNNGSLTVKDHHIIRRTRIISINKLTARELYSTLMSNIENKPTSQMFFEKMFPNRPIKWDEIYLLPRKVTYKTYLRCFQNKISNNILYLNNKLYTSKLANSPLCSFCKHENETTLNIFYSYNSTRRLWSQLKLFLELDTSLLTTTDCDIWFS